MEYVTSIPSSHRTREMFPINLTPFTRPEKALPARNLPLRNRSSYIDDWIERMNDQLYIWWFTIWMDHMQRVLLMEGLDRHSHSERRGPDCHWFIGLGSIDRSLQKRPSSGQTIHSPPPPACPGHGTKGPGCIQFAFPRMHPTLPHPRFPFNMHYPRSESVRFISAFNMSLHFRSIRTSHIRGGHY